MQTKLKIAGAVINEHAIENACSSLIEKQSFTVAGKTGHRYIMRSFQNHVCMCQNANYHSSAAICLGILLCALHVRGPQNGELNYIFVQPGILLADMHAAKGGEREIAISPFAHR